MKLMKPKEPIIL